MVRDGKLVHQTAAGLAAVEQDRRIGPDTVFHIASVSKHVTAFAVLLLERDGKLSLDDDVRTHLPELPDFGQPITLRHLLHHTSGLRDQWSLLTLAGWRMSDVITDDDVFRLVCRQRELNFDPGTRHLYCNTGYTPAARVVARVSGRSFAEFTRTRMFEPLGSPAATRPPGTRRRSPLPSSRTARRYGGPLSSRNRRNLPSWPYTVSPVTHAARTPSRLARRIIRSARRGLVANPRSRGAPAASHRSRSSAHSVGRSNARSRTACPRGPG